MRVWVTIVQGLFVRVRTNIQTFVVGDKCPGKKFLGVLQYVQLGYVAGEVWATAPIQGPWPPM